MRRHSPLERAGYPVQLPPAEREPGLVDSRLVDPAGRHRRLTGP